MTADVDSKRLSQTWDIYADLIRLIAGKAFGSMRVDSDVVKILYDAPDADREALQRLITAHRERRTSYLSVEDLAKRWCVSARLVRRLAESGALVGSKRGGKWEFRPAAVDRFIAAHTRNGNVQIIPPDAEPIALVSAELLDQARISLADLDWQTGDLACQLDIPHDHAYKLILAWVSAGVVEHVKRGWYRFTHAQPPIAAE